MSCQVFIFNGWGTGSEIWEPFIVALCKSQSLKREMIHFLSWEEATQPSDYKSLALSFIEGQLNRASDAPKYILVGWSLGAIVALDSLPDLKYKPSALLILSGSSSFCQETHGSGWQKKDVEAMKNHLIKERAITLKTFYQRCFTRQERNLGYDQVLLEASIAWSEESLVSGLDYLIETDLHGKLPGVDRPILWLHGERDGICPIGGAKIAITQLEQGRLKLVQLVTIPEAGHGLFITSALACIETFNHFIKEIP